MSLIDIRPALPADVTDIQACAQLAFAKYIQRIGRKPAPMHADTAGQIAKGYIDVAIYQSRFVGYVVSYPEGEHIHLDSVAVLTPYSGRGIARRLIEHVERSTKRAGYEAVELYTNEAMTENLAMYPALGYIKISRRREAGFNRVYFRKPL